MKLVKLILQSILIGLSVAITYYVFEGSVRLTINVIWFDIFDTDSYRWIVVPLLLVLSCVYFGVQHRLDPKSDKKEIEPSQYKPTLSNFVKVLVIGFFSLVAGVSLGPEAVLIPACMIIGGYMAVKSGDDLKSGKLLAQISFIALFAAFFSSMYGGLLGLLLASKDSGSKPTPKIILLGALASLVTVGTLSVFSSEPYIKVDSTGSNWDFENIALFALLAVAGYLLVYAMKALFSVLESAEKPLVSSMWWHKGLIAGAVLSLLYLVGGPLIQFTGNETMQPLLDQAPELGVLGVVWIIITKVIAIVWSKSIGYRGGLIFPSVFVATGFVALAQLYDPTLSFMPGMLAVFMGLFFANSKTKALF